MRNLPRIINLFLTAVFVSQMIFYYPIMPDAAAIHFDSNGVADRFVGKQNYLFGEIALMLFGLFFSIVITAIFQKLPDNLINIPQRVYWLKAERRAETMRIFKTFFDWLSVALLTMFVALNQLTIEANLSANKTLSVYFWYVFLAFLIFMAFWLYKFHRRFNRIKKI